MTNLPVLLPTSRKLYTWDLPGSETRLRLRNGSVGFCLVHLATKIDKFVEDLDGDILDDWGYAYRKTRGYAVMSNHARGAAFDFNSLEHPLGAKRTFTKEEILEIEGFLYMYDGFIRWGEHYRTRTDGMHMEWIGTLRDAEKVARKIMMTPIGKAVLRDNPTQRAVILS